jgi:molybdopterin/thiamine biosynthesis adenylyltransferase|tara:strand:+ start:1150 stop:1788 length:639 start_codon:yes stop_codon:yes gene_type:complete
MKIEYNKTERRKILVIGVGGIGSYLVPLLHKSWCYDIHIADNDSVEVKNLLYQNYKQRDVGNLKVIGIKKLLQSTNHDFDIGLAESNTSRYQVLTSKQLEGYDLVICCADNLAVRKLLYSQGFGDNAKLKWLDLRAQGRNGALISYLTDEKFSETFLNGPEGSFSCQGDGFNTSLNTKDLHFTHVAIAGYGAQWIHRWFNGDDVADKFIINI